ncbi:type III secretion system (T3SS) inner membrane Yop/YscD-like protein [Georgenia soli]|uniref:Type III secretion system (T3SS) inner membrane Yop/YscD-like protein n=1 Tax=Georgenia soli TaxID=638953 RepID=A0A2A9END2_9MICO|nr:FHA domain-containing protein [Georgenia soli]PFG39762.1 type III secretion system (T3SS) inner membrane Yop/YscD-like protein [Georgenia soli]
MSELVVTLLRFGFLILLWLFVLAALGVLRKDLFGTRVTARGPGRSRPSRRTTADARPARPPRNAPTRLVVTQGPLAGTTIPLGPSAVLVGRAPACTLVLDDDYSSNRHARFFPKDGAWWVEDLGSTNGTVVAGDRITQPVQVPPGTPVRIGQTLIELRR